MQKDLNSARFSLPSQFLRGASRPFSLKEGVSSVLSGRCCSSRSSAVRGDPRSVLGAVGPHPTVSLPLVLGEDIKN